MCAVRPKTDSKGEVEHLGCLIKAERRPSNVIGGPVEINADAITSQPWSEIALATILPDPSQVDLRLVILNTLTNALMVHYRTYEGCSTRTVSTLLPVHASPVTVVPVHASQDTMALTHDFSGNSGSGGDPSRAVTESIEEQLTRARARNHWRGEEDRHAANRLRDAQAIADHLNQSMDPHHHLKGRQLSLIKVYDDFEEDMDDAINREKHLHVLIEDETDLVGEPVPGITLARKLRGESRDFRRASDRIRLLMADPEVVRSWRSQMESLAQGLPRPGSDDGSEPDSDADSLHYTSHRCLSIG
ncbi:uncharacterized protein MKK02DRAFT_40490 [Dioszegia hungarica]|uniref:Uncharacterized protein n=1 Tax=Dioszegia hungarica TaxID=4972 RepID=A0AA38LT69_9TREE|nr:uncharacterized protein MKK02DRAFT_40490 [Dioszegia hungarica]KAI9632191.1 hypothetical protein MKK02DRAFT_40490 [Dioszegia hungarica]